MNLNALRLRFRRLVSQSGRRMLVGVLLCLLASGCGGGSTSPDGNLTGVWNGTLSQPNGPVYRDFVYSMDLRASGSSVMGTARISLIGQPQYYGDFEILGTANGAGFDFTELRITAQVRPPSGSNWCLKSGTLTLGGGGQTLSGNWTSTGCTPGTISLTRG